MRSSRPLIYNVGDGDIWNTWRGGTCFAIRWRLGTKNRYFCVAARHTIVKMMGGELTPENVDNIRVLRHSNIERHERLVERDWARIVTYHPFSEEAKFQHLFGDPDVSDFIILEAEDDAFDGVSSVFTVRPKLIGMIKSEIYSSIDGPLNSVLISSGFPSVNNTIDYDSEAIVFHRQLVSGRYDKKSDASPIGQIDCTGFPDLPTDFDGLSGSPVFSFHEDQFKLAGIVIRGTASSKRLYFIKSNAIGFALFTCSLHSEASMRRFHSENHKHRRRVKSKT
ncbi:hypothetical protein GOX2599 (plasmid) [Gluconobacter oxydans 621H]|uniref:Peptidase S1 domain-containing protein n=2 Tax=Gluconobacter oxydans TaxID=442 RepID=Q5HXU0_GLUOX|nr:hypothetical protein GOX2599 [Gluconobacter oxydans 621H]